MAIRQGLGIIALCFTASSVLADEVLFCTDTAAVGFKSGNDATKPPTQAPFKRRFTIKVVSVSETARIITSNDDPGRRTL